MQENQFKLELLPQGAFLLTLTDGQQIKGRFSMYALNRFGKSNNAENYFELIQKIAVGMGLEDYAELIAVAIQDYYRKDFKQCVWDAEKVMDEILEPMGGTAGPDFVTLIKHAVGRLTTYQDAPTDKEGEIASDQEKKN